MVVQNLEAVLQATAQRLPKNFRGRIGVFFCGAPYLGMEISDRCAMQRSTTGQKWEFKGEVFRPNAQKQIQQELRDSLPVSTNQTLLSPIPVALLHAHARFRTAFA